MLSAKAQYSLGDARKYLKEHLSIGDYYSEGQEVLGQWYGKGAEDLGLSGVTRAEEFLRLCDNLHPQTGERLTLRQNTTRKDIGSDGREHQSKNRRVFYDFTISPPKSVSIAALVGNDPRIVQAHEQAVSAAMDQLQSYASTRVRKQGQTTDRTTGNIVAATFRHETSRALDPHLHTHCIVFNATFDSIEKQWKALQNHDMLGAQKFVENVYYHELTRKLRQFGYGIQNKPRGDFVIQGVATALVEKFSKRHQEIDEKTRELLERKPEMADGNIAAIRENIAHNERARKIKDIGLSRLRALWDGQMTETEKDSLSHLTATPAPSSVSSEDLAEKAVSWAEEHLFDRRSVVNEHELWRHALEHARGQSLSVAEIQKITRDRGYVRREGRPGTVTTREHLLCEWEIVQTAKEGWYSSYPLVWSPGPASPQLNEEQRRAFDALISNTSVVSIFRGGAGTGKSFVLRELVDQVQQSERAVVVFAPQRQQVVEMEKAGFPLPRTVSSFLQRPELEKGALIVVDEAGQIGGRQMLELMRLVRERNARLVLSGDTRQHGAVEASDALLAIERYAGVKPVELHKIRRQDPALGKDEDERVRIRRYRKAVELAAAGKLDESFEQLDKMGAVVPCSLSDQAEKLADEYLRLMERNASVVVVSQTWTEVQRINSRIRDALKAKGLLGAEESTIQSLERIDLTNAQKRDERFYPKDVVIVFNQRVRDAKSGASGKPACMLKTGVLVEVDGRLVTVSNRLLDRISICSPRELSIAAGDRLHLKANRTLASGDRVTNGELVTVKSVRTDGGIALTDGRVLDPTYREFMPGYAITSYGSKGKTVDYVLFSDSTIKPATNDQQWYVTISRGRRGIRIFTPDKEQLREDITRSGQRPLAMEFGESLDRRPGVMLWDRLYPYLLRFGKQAADTVCRLKKSKARQRLLTQKRQIQLGETQSRGVHA